jgi:hypothetical protein
MATPAIQTLITDAQQVLNLKSLSEIRATMAAALANANVGTPLNPNLTTQQLWDQFYLIVRQPESDIESIITNQLMKFLFAPPAPGGVGGNHEVIYNNNGVLAGDPKFLWEDALNRLDIDGSATISGDLTVDTNVLKVDTTLNRVGIGTASPTSDLDIFRASGSGITSGISLRTAAGAGGDGSFIKWLSGGTNEKVAQIDGVLNGTDVGYLSFLCGNGADAMAEQYRVASSGVFTWYDGAGAGGTRMTLNSTGLGVGTSNFAYKINAAGFIAAVDPSFTGTGGSLIGAMLNNDNAAPGLDLRRWTGSAGNHGTTYISTDSTGATFFYNGLQASNTKATSLKMTLDASGRLLVGNTNAFSDLTGSKEVRIGESGMQTFSIAPLPAATATDIARGGVGGLVYVGGYNVTGQYGAVVLYTAASATVVSVINGTGSVITFGVVAGFLQITSSLALTQVTAACIRI